MVHPSCTCRVADVLESWRIISAVVARALLIRPRQRIERLGAMCRDGQEVRFARQSCFARLTRRTLGRIGQYDVGIGAGDAKGAHTRDGRLGARRPRGHLPLDNQGKVAPWNLRVRLLTVEARGNRAVLQRKRHFDDPRNTRRALGVSDIGLDRADPTRLTGRSIDTEHSSEGQCLDGIAYTRARAVGFDVLHLARSDTAISIGLAQYRLPVLRDSASSAARRYGRRY